MRILSWNPAKRLVLSYVFDWIVIFVIAGIGGAFAVSTPYKRPFSLVDLSIQYPYVRHQIIPIWLLVVVALVAPAVIIFIVCLAFVPGPTISKKTPRPLVWRRKLWEWNTSWMGLGLSLALAFMFTQGMKNLFGKPRPNLLARCQPDLSVQSIARNALGGYATGFNREWVLVGAGICQQQDSSTLNDGFRSFPSGHASFSWSGLLYLALFLASKFAIGIPFLPPKRLTTESPAELDSYLGSEDELKNGSAEASGRAAVRSNIPPRNQAAAPPVYLLALPLVPICAAIYITSTRYFQFYHHGFDIIVGSLIGVLSAYFAFRFYHLPISQGAGWSWGARSRDRAFAIGVGVPGYVGPEGWTSKGRPTTSARRADDVRDATSEDKEPRGEDAV
ncbi:hypothetical protein, variant [Verruconis gallopava]|uniref:Phosphatidic acid phosphatase type 2/haloperoxidase domain-containing protein n=1 Tax=Verruconis gallopava TaxID=253628 RepID=A0A0D2B6I9_9PEZI|nr:uncharacterized protein PV09_02530 [Verruconis gallopava]XP_016216723.1 hypothetical protein, variant [Verruconis gallopava]KIW06853.1 hypothetical protein PV09_02530 [Verruconis gallopava]KIW06854.1 hypothetical protein, variant [Verruconis gallopava]